MESGFKERCTGTRLPSCACSVLSPALPDGFASSILRKLAADVGAMKAWIDSPISLSRGVFSSWARLRLQ
jgi:hypothetical protein